MSAKSPFWPNVVHCLRSVLVVVYHSDVQRATQTKIFGVNLPYFPCWLFGMIIVMFAWEQGWRHRLDWGGIVHHRLDWGGGSAFIPKQERYKKHQVYLLAINFTSCPPHFLKAGAAPTSEQIQNCLHLHGNGSSLEPSSPACATVITNWCVSTSISYPSKKNV